MFFNFVTKHACDRRTDRITIPKTMLAYMLRMVQTVMAKMKLIYITEHYVTDAAHLNTAKHQVQKLNGMSKCIMAEVAEDVEEAEMSDSSITLNCSDHLTSAITASHLHRPRQEAIHSRHTAG